MTLCLCFLYYSFTSLYNILIPALNRRSCRTLSSLRCRSRCSPEALDKGNFILAGITTERVLQAVDVAVEMNKNGDLGVPVPNYTDANVSTKVVKLIQSYTGVVNKMVWRKDS